MRCFVSATGGSADDVSGFTVGAGTVTDGTLPKGTSSTAIREGRPEIDGNKAGATSDA